MIFSHRYLDITEQHKWCRGRCMNGTNLRFGEILDGSCDSIADFFSFLYKYVYIWMKWSTVHQPLHHHHHHPPPQHYIKIGELCFEVSNDNNNNNNNNFFYDSAFPLRTKTFYCASLPGSLDSGSVLHLECTFSSPWGAFRAFAILIMNNRSLVVIVTSAIWVRVVESRISWSPWSLFMRRVRSHVGTPMTSGIPTLLPCMLSLKNCIVHKILYLIISCW